MYTVQSSTQSTPFSISDSDDEETPAFKDKFICMKEIIKANLGALFLNLSVLSKIPQILVELKIFFILQYF